MTLDQLLATEKPDEIYHLAAVHGPAGYAYEAVWQAALAVNLGTLHTCLEHIRTRTGHARLFYASSLKAFCEHPPAVIDEETPRVSNCLYSITKNAAFDLVRYYREHHGVWGCVGFFSNHESPRRADSFFLPRLVTWLAGQVRGTAAPAPASLDFWGDWGSSREFMALAADLLRVADPTDLMFATGQPVYAAELAARLAHSLGLAAPQVTSTGASPRRIEIGRMSAVLGRVPEHGAIAVAYWILRERHGLVPDSVQ
jgi:GDPmannose 4,6-dehydratase